MGFCKCVYDQKNILRFWFFTIRTWLETFLTNQKNVFPLLLLNRRFSYEKKNPIVQFVKFFNGFFSFLCLQFQRVNIGQTNSTVYSCIQLRWVYSFDYLIFFAKWTPYNLMDSILHFAFYVQSSSALDMMRLMD